MDKHIRSHHCKVLLALFAYLCATVACIACSGCWGSLPRLPEAPAIHAPAAPDVTGNAFLELSPWFIWIGILIAGLSVVLGIACTFGAASGILGILLAIVRPFLRFAGWAGFGAILFGVALHWTGDHPILALASVLVAGVGWYLHGHPSFGGRLVGWLTSQSRPKRVIDPGPG